VQMNRIVPHRLIGWCERLVIDKERPRLLCDLLRNGVMLTHRCLPVIEGVRVLRIESEGREQNLEAVGLRERDHLTDVALEIDRAVLGDVLSDIVAVLGRASGGIDETGTGILLQADLNRQKAIEREGAKLRRDRTYQMARVKSQKRTRIVVARGWNLTG